MAVHLSAAVCVDWVARLIGAPGAADVFARAEAAGPANGPELFLPYLSGERTPHNDAQVRGGFLHLDHDSTPERLAQAVLEGVAFALLGDLNRGIAGPQDDLLRALAGAAPLTRATEGVSDPCWAGARGARRFVDHILLGGEARRWVVPDSLRVLVYAERDRAWRERLSDHCPLSLRLRPG